MKIILLYLKNLHNKSLIAICIFLISLTQYSCVSNNKTKRIVVASSGKIESLDPARANTLKSLQLLNSLGDTLYELNSDGDLVPELASEMPIFSKDKLQITINLRTNVLFHDGTSFNSNS